MTTATRPRPKTRKRAATGSKRDVYQEVTNTLVAALEAGTVPWERPWTVTGLPLRMNNRQPYRGINNFVLWLTAAQRGYASPWWGTYDQIAELSGMERRTNANGHSYWVSPDGTERGVRKGETGTLVVFWKRTRYTATDEVTGEETSRNSALIRYSYAYNAEQAAQLPARYYPDALEAPAHEPGEADAMIIGYLARNPGLTYTEADASRAYYQASADLLNVPPLASFSDVNAWHGVRFHEAAHSTGHTSRLDRPVGTCVFGAPDYAREELVAQMTAAMLLAVTGTASDTETQRSAAYLASWITALKGDSKLAVLAAANAQRAADLIRGVTFENDDD